MNVLDLFSGIGGFSLGLERAGMRTVAFCEIDPYCRRVLARHWPNVPVFGDVRELTAKILSDSYGFRCNGYNRVSSTEGIGATDKSRDHIGSVNPVARTIDVICGGFPCQDISTAGKGAGITGARSGLWSEYARIIGEVRPRYVIVENVAALLGRGLSTVLGDLAALGFDAEWHCIPASAVGAPHRRDRVWVIAHSTVSGLEGRNEPEATWETQPELARCGSVAITEGGRCGTWWTRRPFGVGAWIREFALSDTNGEQAERSAIAWGECGHWLTEPDVGRVAHGVPSRVDRLRSLGNAVVPQIPEIIGRAIMTSAP